MGTARRVAGLRAPAEIAIDRWGVPHIRAESLHDLFLAQGFNAARDRLWQIDLWRKRGLGLLSAELGPGFLEQDRAARLMLYRGDMATEWAAYADDAEEICAAFVAGINAYVALTETQPDLLPPEFAVAGMRPARWRAEDVVRIRSHGLIRNALSEVLRANVQSRAGARADLLRKKIEPERLAAIPDGLDLAAIPMAVLDVFKLAVAPATLTPERCAATLEQAAAWRRVGDLGDVIRDLEAEGSNNWTISGALTDTGRPVLANDPHRLHALPGLRYLVHLTAPGFDAIGAGEPCVPGVSLGHNGTCAFGLTIFGADQEDIYVYETRPDDPGAYRYGDGWERMRVIHESVPVRGHPDQPCEMAFTRHGPVLFAEPAKRTAFALRSVWFEPGAAPYMASLTTMRARDVDGFREGVRRWGTPSVNLVYADTGGTIGWFPAGKTPVRPTSDGLLPVPGDGRHEWDGFLDPDLMPRSVNPPAGYVATANEMNLPEGWDQSARQIGHEWLERSRITRIREVLEAQRALGVAVSRALQTDATSVVARRLGRLAAALSPAEPDAAAAVALLRDFDGRLAPDSAAAALVEVWWTRHLRKALFASVVPDEAVRRLLPPGDSETILPVLEGALPGFGLDAPEDRRRLLSASLAAAWRECAALLGPDAGGWAWGRLHHALFEHPLRGFAGDEATPDIGPLPIGGSSYSPMHTGYRPGDFRVTTGASVRVVVDVGGWDGSVWINAPGQSGDPRSRHYADLAQLWAAGGYAPMLYSRALVEPEIVDRIALTPATASAQ